MLPPGDREPAEEGEGEGVFAPRSTPELGVRLGLSMRVRERSRSLVFDFDFVGATASDGVWSGSEPEWLAERPFRNESGVCGADGTAIPLTAGALSKSSPRRCSLGYLCGSAGGWMRDSEECSWVVESDGRLSRAGGGGWFCEWGIWWLRKRFRSWSGPCLADKGAGVGGGEPSAGVSGGVTWRGVTGSERVLMLDFLENRNREEAPRDGCGAGEVGWVGLPSGGGVLVGEA